MNDDTIDARAWGGGHPRHYCDHGPNIRGHRCACPLGHDHTADELDREFNLQ